MPFKYIATDANGKEHYRKSGRAYSHAVAIHIPAEGWIVKSWCGRPDLVPAQVKYWEKCGYKVATLPLVVEEKPANAAAIPEKKAPKEEVEKPEPVAKESKQAADYWAALPDGRIATRRSTRAFTHAVVDNGLMGAWRAHCWASSADRAKIKARALMKESPELQVEIIEAQTGEQPAPAPVAPEPVAEPAPKKMAFELAESDDKTEKAAADNVRRVADFKRRNKMKSTSLRADALEAVEAYQSKHGIKNRSDAILKLVSQAALIDFDPAP